MFISLIGLVILLCFVYVNHWVFTHWLNMSYIEWYIESGALIGIVTTAISLVWGDMLDKEWWNVSMPDKPAAITGLFSSLYF